MSGPKFVSFISGIIYTFAAHFKLSSACFHTHDKRSIFFLHAKLDFGVFSIQLGIFVSRVLAIVCCCIPFTELARVAESSYVTCELSVQMQNYVQIIFDVPQLPNLWIW